MERLTKRSVAGEAVPVAEGNICAPFVKAGLCLTGTGLVIDGEYKHGWERHCNDKCVLGMMIDRLAEIEDKLESGQLVEVAHGEWKPTEDYRVALACSNCNCTMPYVPELAGRDLPYCPNCGAKMDGEPKK